VRIPQAAREDLSPVPNEGCLERINPDQTASRTSARTMARLRYKRPGGVAGRRFGVLFPPTWRTKL